MAFKKATKAQSKLRMALIGPSGSGKTYTALKIAGLLGNKVACIDTERGSASKYADKFSFDVLELESFHPQRYIDAIGEAVKAGYDVLIIDSLSHAWAGKDGLLEFVDKQARASQSNNAFAAWRQATPLHNQLVDAMLGANLHLIVTMRAKTEYIMETDPKTGKTVPRKVGLQPIQRDGLEYEMDVVADMTPAIDLVISKTRCDELTGQVFNKPGPDVADILRTWLSDGVPIAQPKPEAEPTKPIQAAGPSAAPPVPAAGEPPRPIHPSQFTKLGQLLANHSQQQLEDFKRRLNNSFGSEDMGKLTYDQAAKVIKALEKEA